MREAICRVTGVSRYSQSKYISEDKGRDETHEEFEKRSWRERCHTGSDGKLIIPPMQFKKALENAAAYKSQKIPGKGMATYTKHFKAGVMCFAPLPLGIPLDEVEGEWLLLKPPTQKGAVMKCMPYVDHWSGVATFAVLDDCIPEDVFERTLIDAGSYIGIGRFRPQVGGYYGRFHVDSIDWKTA